MVIASPRVTSEAAICMDHVQQRRIQLRMDGNMNMAADNGVTNRPRVTNYFRFPFIFIRRDEYFFREFIIIGLCLIAENIKRKCYSSEKGGEKLFRAKHLQKLLVGKNVTQRQTTEAKSLHSFLIYHLISHHLPDSNQKTELSLSGGGNARK